MFPWPRQKHHPTNPTVIPPWDTPVNRAGAPSSISGGSLFFQGKQQNTGLLGRVCSLCFPQQNTPALNCLQQANYKLLRYYHLALIFNNWSSGTNTSRKSRPQQRPVRVNKWYSRQSCCSALSSGSHDASHTRTAAFASPCRGCFQQL